MNLKEYINKNVSLRNDAFFKLRLSRFNKCVDKIVFKYQDNDKFNYFINYYLKIEKGYGIDLMIILICSLSYNSNLLNYNVEIIDDIITMFYDDEPTIFEYEKLLDVFLLPTTVGWLNVFHTLKNTRNMDFDINILLSIITLLNLNKKRNILEEEIDEMMMNIFDIFDPTKDIRLFNDNDSLDEMYEIIINKIDYINGILISYDLTKYFTEEDLQKQWNLKCEKLRLELLCVDKSNLSDIEKISVILKLIPNNSKKKTNKIIEFRSE